MDDHDHLDRTLPLRLTTDEAIHGCKRTVLVTRTVRTGGRLVAREERLTVTVPAGVRTGLRLRLAGKGDEDLEGHLGDLYLELQAPVTYVDATPAVVFWSTARKVGLGFVIVGAAFLAFSLWTVWQKVGAPRVEIHVTPIVFGFLGMFFGAVCILGNVHPGIDLSAVGKRRLAVLVAVSFAVCAAAGVTFYQVVRQLERLGYRRWP